MLMQDNILGYNCTLWYEARFRAGSNSVGTIIKSAPDTNNDSRKVSKGFTFSIEGSVSGGVSSKEGKVEAKADVSIKPSWKWEFARPKNGPQGYGGVWLEDVALAGRSSVSLKSEFVMQVKKEEWKKYPNIKLVVDFYSKEGATEGGGATWGIGNAGRRDYTYDWNKKGNEYTLPRPPHIAVTQAKFNYKATAAKGDTQTVMLQSEENWTATTNASWIHLTTAENNTTTKDGKESISGTATGLAQKQIMISVDPVTDGRPRGGKIIFKASDGEICTVEILQAGK